MPKDEKVAILKDSLAAIGGRIEMVLNAKQQAGEDRERWRRHLWTCVFIDNLSSYSRLKIFADSSPSSGPRKLKLPS
jgi:hypothetical protein